MGQCFLSRHSAERAALCSVENETDVLMDTHLLNAEHA